MKIEILTLFPSMFEGPFKYSIIERAIEQKLATINVHDLRQFGIGERKTVDDRPYGGGAGMILMIEPIYKALSAIKNEGESPKIVLMSPQGKKFTQAKALEYSRLKQLILIAGRYEGFDERIVDHLVDEEVSIGDYVLTGGEIPSMVVTDAVVRLIPGVVPKEASTQLESFSDPSLVEYAQYTRPPEFNSWKVPDILLSGDHKKIEDWKKASSLAKTRKNRPDLLRE